ncbi:Protein NRT1/ PTR FAMILY 5.10 [Hibiscus syriacus]|uniref:Protein NRT1/ PTR FAMILY 5.10 n=1 Tax=Hibiscus syriacus TaxID=106335 RepID=A0A6A2ZNA9_HIBSY|nr:Protein NRT1/ PTR FAMILY 5.10 [Hibiscus syriacus]
MPPTFPVFFFLKKLPIGADLQIYLRFLLVLTRSGGRGFLAAWKLGRRRVALGYQTLGFPSGTIWTVGSCQIQRLFLNKALLAPDGTKEPGNVCSIREVEEAKAILRLAPIWVASLIYAAGLAQGSTLFTKQAATIDRSITKRLKIPSASLQCFISVAVLLFIPIYDPFFVPLARFVNGKLTGITMLQRIGIEIALFSVAMVTAAIIEMKRLKTTQEHGLVDKPNMMVPMCVWWLVPQYSLYGLSDVFAIVGLQEFFYDQMSSELRSTRIAVYISAIEVGNLISSFLIYVIERVSGGDDWMACLQIIWIGHI